MGLSERLVRELRKKFEPSAMIDLKLSGKDARIRTDSSGNPVVLFLGRRGEDGRIKGERFSRTLVADSSGKILKDHWDRKGKV